MQYSTQLKSAVVVDRDWVNFMVYINIHYYLLINHKKQLAMYRLVLNPPYNYDSYWLMESPWRDMWIIGW